MAASSLSRHASPTTSLPDAWRVEVFRRDSMDDPEGEHMKRAALELGVAGLARARYGRGFLLPPSLSASEVESAARELLSDAVLDDVRITSPKSPPSAHTARAQRIVVARKPGVMDPVALTVQRALWRSGLVPAAREEAFLVTTFRVFELEHEPARSGAAKFDRATLVSVGEKILANPTIEDVHVDSEALSFVRPPPSPRHGVVKVPLANASDERLSEISRQGVLSLSLVEMKAIQSHYREVGRDPTSCELETLAQTWSEHCKHKTFTGIVEMDGERIDNLLKQTIKAATLELARPWCVSVFHDNAGVIAFDQGFDVCFKVETHNHPSAIDPYGGAGTGIGGVIRDVLGVGLGARPIANTDAFFVGPTELPREELPKGTLHPRRILRGVVAGVRDYGNRMGIPTVSGGVWFHPAYVANPLVYAGTVGILPHWAATKSVEAGDQIVVVGGRTGRDGIHGATFSSIELSDESDVVSSAAVQIGDAITEKRVQDALLQARDAKLYRAITDCGAGGLSSAVGEMAEKTGARVHLERVPLKYPGLSPEEIWISEAQERMVLAVPPESLARLLATFAAEDVEATVIGEFTSTRRLELFASGELFCDLDLHFLHEGTPRTVRRATWKAPAHRDPGCPAVSDHRQVLLALLSAPDIASKEWIIRQYDHEVQGRAVLKPLVGVRRDSPGDAAVLKPLDNSDKGLAIACGANPRFGVLDPGAMAEAVIDEALRNVVAVGGDLDHTAILDNFSWGNCDKPEQMGSLVLAARGCQRAAVAFGTPFISGKDSLNNEYRVGDRTLSIPPTLLISALSVVPDVRRAVSMDFKRAGSRLYLVGMTKAELGGSHFLEQRGAIGGRVPRPDLGLAPRSMRALSKAIRSGAIASCHDLSEGGLAVAAAEMCFAGELGAMIELAAVPVETFDRSFDPESTRLYSESCSRFLVEVAEGRAQEFERELAGLPFASIGKVTSDKRLLVRGTGGVTLLDVDVEELRSAFLGGFQG
jgi:phosphoribosylformylglycinamidine synthase